MTFPAAWAVALDRLVADRPELGMCLARARVEVRQYPAGPVLIVRVPDDVAQELRDARDSYEPAILAACAAVGIEVAAIAFVDAETCR
jgi:hypothetical protein